MLGRNLGYPTPMLPSNSYKARPTDISHQPKALSGVASAYMTSLFLGPIAAMAFAVGSSVGYVGSTIYYWNTTQESALQAFESYPQLMMLHLIRNYRTLGFEKVPMETDEDKRAFQERLRREMRLRCLLMAAWHSARSNIDVSCFSLGLVGEGRC